jgi:hypothetical protein
MSLAPRKRISSYSKIASPPIQTWDKEPFRALLHIVEILGNGPYVDHQTNHKTQQHHNKLILPKLTRYEQKSRRKDLQADNSLASESTSQKDQHGTRGDGGTNLGRVANRSRALLDNNVISRVVSALLALNGGGGRFVFEGEFLRLSTVLQDLESSSHFSNIL